MTRPNMGKTAPVLLYASMRLVPDYETYLPYNRYFYFHFVIVITLYLFNVFIIYFTLNTLLPIIIISSSSIIIILLLL